MDMTREEIERLTEEITNISAFDAVHYPYISPYIHQKPNVNTGESV
jgi:hypothetical protein